MKYILWIILFLGYLAIPISFLKFSYFTITDISTVILSVSLILLLSKIKLKLSLILIVIITNLYVFINVIVNGVFFTSGIFVFFGLQIVFWTIVIGFDKKSTTIIALISTVFLVLVGLYRLFYPSSNMEILLWWWRDSPYFGIRYTESTRNSDVFYFITGFIFTLYAYRSKIIRSKKLVIFLILIFVLAIIFSFSRGAWITLIGSYFVFSLLESRKKNLSKNFITVLMFLVPLILLYYLGYQEYLFNRLFSIFSISISSSNDERFKLLFEGIRFGLNHPLGIGLNNTFRIFEFGNFENIFVNVLVELGIIPCLALISFLVYPLFVISKSKAIRNRSMIGFVFTALILFGFFNYILLEMSFWILSGFGYFLLYEGIRL